MTEGKYDADRIDAQENPGLASPRGARYLFASEGSLMRKEGGMDEDLFNMELRKFLKKVGVTSQREIEQAVRAGIESGKLSGSETIKAKITLTIEGLDVSHEVDGEISLG